jgi:flagellar FliJ protein
MSSKLPLDTLIDLAQQNTDEAARRLGILHRERVNAQKQLTLLQDYRQDYLERLQSAMQNGISAGDCHNYQRFIATLDDAISRQGVVVSRADEELALGRIAWQQENRKLNSFGALAQREARVRQAQEARREQRVNDEYAARLVRRQTGLR